MLNKTVLRQFSSSSVFVMYTLTSGFIIDTRYVIMHANGSDWAGLCLTRLRNKAGKNGGMESNTKCFTPCFNTWQVQSDCTQADNNYKYLYLMRTELSFQFTLIISLCFCIFYFHPLHLFRLHRRTCTRVVILLTNKSFKTQKTSWCLQYANWLRQVVK